MGIWFVALTLIIVLVVAGTIATRRRWPEATHDWPVLIAVRIAGIVLVTAAVIVAARAAGPLAAAVTGVLGVALLIWVLGRTGYARLPVPHR